MKINMDTMGLVIKCKIITICLLLCLTKIASGQNSDSLSVVLCKSDSIFFVDLLFYNETNDTVILPAQFKNITLEWQSGIGIAVNSFINGKSFVINRNIDSSFIFGISRFFQLSPKSSIKYKINIRDYFSSLKKENEYSVSLDVNYLYVQFSGKKRRKSKMNRITTNIVVVEGE